MKLQVHTKTVTRNIKNKDVLMQYTRQGNHVDVYLVGDKGALTTLQSTDFETVSAAKKFMQEA